MTEKNFLDTAQELWEIVTFPHAAFSRPELEDIWFTHEAFKEFSGKAFKASFHLKGIPAQEKAEISAEYDYWPHGAIGEMTFYTELKLDEEKSLFTRINGICEICTDALFTIGPQVFSGSFLVDGFSRDIAREDKVREISRAMGLIQVVFPDAIVILGNLPKINWREMILSSQSFGIMKKGV